jgi:hypothetical protein
MCTEMEPSFPEWLMLNKIISVLQMVFNVFIEGNTVFTTSGNLIRLVSMFSI